MGYSPWGRKESNTTDWLTHERKMVMRSEVKSLSRARLFVTPWIVACTKLLRPWDFQGKGTGVGWHFLLQGIFPTQGLNPGLSHCRQTLYRLSHQRSPSNEKERLKFPVSHQWGSMVAQLVKNPPTMWETWVPSLGWEDPLETGIATHSSIHGLPWWFKG